MNEKIKQLWDDSIEEFSKQHRYATIMLPEPLREKFAELIVRECCSKLVEMGESWHEFARNPPEGQAHNASGALFAAYRLKEDAVDEIKEHFGVEE
jgi:hypothetical protein